MIIISLATEKTKEFKEFEQTLQKNNYKYKIIGLNQPWEGFITKMNLYVKELKELKQRNPNELVIVCDSYDLLFIRKPDYLEKLYYEKANGKVIIGLENQTDFLCSIISPVCDKDIIKKCNIKNPHYPDIKYINSGFIMGPVKLVLDIFSFIKINDIRDDQEGLYKWVSENCDKCYYDYHVDFILNYMPPCLISKPIKTSFEGHLIKVRKNSYPCAIHMPGQYLDLGYRSEKYRNFLIPSRKNIKKIEYFKQIYGKFCSPEFSYLGYWWWVVVIFIILIIIVLIRYFNK